MKNENVIKKFLDREHAKTPKRYITNGYYAYEGRTLWTREVNGVFELINYNTRIAYIDQNGLHINIKKYSVTTSKIQNQIRILADNTNYKVFEYQE
jgi:hypothetical protein